MGELIAAYIFGSVGRGDHDDRSDLDVIAVVRNRAGMVDESEVTSCIPVHLSGLKSSVSWYGEKRVAEMFRNGELFAWHLYLETVPIFERRPVIFSLGRPSDYRDVAADILSFQKILQGIPSQLAENEANAIYEVGLIYVCLRNISMAASWSLCDRPDFSRYSPFRLRHVSACPISVSDYESAMACRMASQRGLAPPPGIDANLARRLYALLAPWVEDVRLSVSGEAAFG